ncbi:MAG: hypothetical protein Q9165_007246 [Trypethelium subeluteriae]
MPIILPTQAALSAAFSPLLPSSRPKAQAPQAPRTSLRAREHLYPNWSVADDAKAKTNQLSDAAVKEFEKASSKAQQSVGSGKIELYSPQFYAACTFGGLLACVSIISRELKESYSVQGAFKYGGYEWFKKFYSDLAGPENAYKYKTWIYLAGSASAEFIADIGLCPFEAVKVRMQTTIPPFAKGTFDGISKVTSAEGTSGLYKGLYPLWGRQIPYTMMKFASFETVVEMIYHRLPGQKSDYGKAAQTGVSFAGGYIAGILCAIVSHPADVMVSKLNANRQPGEAFGSAMGRIYKDIGFAGLWNGLPVRIVMIGTLTGLQWMIYDYFKIFMGFPTTGGAAPPEKQKA